MKKFRNLFKALALFAGCFLLFSCEKDKPIPLHTEYNQSTSFYDLDVQIAYKLDYYQLGSEITDENDLELKINFEGNVNGADTMRIYFDDEVLATYINVIPYKNVFKLSNIRLGNGVMHTIMISHKKNGVERVGALKLDFFGYSSWNNNVVMNYSKSPVLTSTALGDTVNVFFEYRNNPNGSGYVGHPCVEVLKKSGSRRIDSVLVVVDGRPVSLINQNGFSGLTRMSQDVEIESGAHYITFEAYLKPVSGARDTSEKVVMPLEWFDIDQHSDPCWEKNIEKGIVLSESSADEHVNVNLLFKLTGRTCESLLATSSPQIDVELNDNHTVEMVLSVDIDNQTVAFWNDLGEDSNPQEMALQNLAYGRHYVNVIFLSAMHDSWGNVISQNVQERQFVIYI